MSVVKKERLTWNCLSDPPLKSNITVKPLWTFWRDVNEMRSFNQIRFVERSLTKSRLNSVKFGYSTFFFEQTPKTFIFQSDRDTLIFICVFIRHGQRRPSVVHWYTPWSKSYFDYGDCRFAFGFSWIQIFIETRHLSYLGLRKRWRLEGKRTLLFNGIPNWFRPTLTT